jgi:hypothetical protein
MFNIAFFIIWIIIFCALGYLILQATRNIREVNESKLTYTLNTNDISCYPKGDINLLPQLGNTCCVINGETTTLRPFTIPQYNLDVIVDTTITPFQDACYGFCASVDPVDGSCNDSPTGQGQYAKCIQALIPVTQIIDGVLVTSKSTTVLSNTFTDIQGCTTSALPVAHLDTVPYYVSLKRFTPFGLNPDAIDNCPQQVPC